MMVKIRTQLAYRKNYGSERSTSDIKYIVIHYTGNDGDKAKSNANWFASKYRGASAHYFVDDTEIVQTVPDRYVAYSVGGNYGGGEYYKIATNANTLNIELCDTTVDGIIYPSAQTIKNALELVRAKMEQYSIPSAKVIRHFDVNGKQCPAYWVNTDRWKKEFWSKILDQEKSTTITSVPVKSKKVLIKEGQAASVVFTDKSILVDGVVGPETRKAKARVVQHAMNLDYGAGLAEDGSFGKLSKRALSGHYVKRGEKQYMVTAAEILMKLQGIDPNGIEYPGHYGNGLTLAKRSFDGSDGSIIREKDFLKLIGV